MAVRETLNEHPKTTAGVVGGLILILLIYMFWPSGSGAPPTPGKVYFTTNESASTASDCFLDLASSTSLPPFDHEGKPAMRAHVYKCGGNEFVAYLEQYSKQNKIARENMLKDPNAEPRMFASIRMDVKKPGAGPWIKPNTKEWLEVRDVKCPDGKEPVEVNP